MVTIKELTEEILTFLEEKKEEVEAQMSEEAFPFLEAHENPQDPDHDLAKVEINKIVTETNKLKDSVERIEGFIQAYLT